jgi:PhoPQ-activated pathogenicity-related protein
LKLNRTIALLATLLSAAACASPLLDTRTPDPSFRVTPNGTSSVGGVTITRATLTSQTWKSGDWTHRLSIFRPPSPSHDDFCVLLISGSGDGAGEDLVGTVLATSVGVPVAVLLDVPNQPLYGDKREDELIAHTWTEYLKSGDESWPLLLPMVESALRAMDAVQSLSKSAGHPEIKRFLVTGASKRGWTTWLTAATKDPRVKAIAPMVIDVLNMEKQLPHQVESYGKASEQIADYERAGLLDALQTPRGKRLLEIVDPYSYRKELTLPKLLILGTNDPYWTQDALNLYWDGLPGAKWVLYTPNSGHGLDDRLRVLATLGAFARSVADGKPLPRPSWKWNGNTLTVTSNPKPVSARFWTTSAPTRDFRKSKWTSKEIPVRNGRVAVELRRPQSGYAAGFVELTYRQGAGNYTVSTQLRIVGRQ